MDNNGALTLGMVGNNPLSLLSSGRFECGGLLPGAWLAAYTPLDGALLLTTQPPDGFIGVQEGDLSSTLYAAQYQFTFPNLAGMDLLVDVQSSPARRPIGAGIQLPPVHIMVKARNHTHNELPIALAISWQDLQKKSPRPCQRVPQGLIVALGDGTRLSTTCAWPRTRFSFCTGWNPGGSGEEIWDDFFAYGEFSSQHNDSFASALCAHSLVSPQQDIQFQFFLHNETGN